MTAYVFTCAAQQKHGYANLLCSLPFASVSFGMHALLTACRKYKKHSSRADMICSDAWCPGGRQLYSIYAVHGLLDRQYCQASGSAVGPVHSCRPRRILTRSLADALATAERECRGYVRPGNKHLPRDSRIVSLSGMLWLCLMCVKVTS